MKKIMRSVVEPFYFFLKPFSELLFISKFGFKCFMTLILSRYENEFSVQFWWKNIPGFFTLENHWQLHFILVGHRWSYELIFFKNIGKGLCWRNKTERKITMIAENLSLLSKNNISTYLEIWSVNGSSKKTQSSDLSIVSGRGILIAECHVCECILPFSSRSHLHKYILYVVSNPWLATLC